MPSLKELKKTYPGKKITTYEVFVVNGEFLYGRQATAEAMRITNRTLTNWMKDGLEPHILSTKNTLLFDLDEVREWRRVNKATKEDKPKDDENVTPDQRKYDAHDPDAKITMWNAGLAEQVEKAQVKKLERIAKEDEQKIRRGEWIASEEVDKTQKSFITIMLQTLTNKLTSLPPRLANKGQAEINKILESEFKDLVFQLKKALTKALKHERKE